MPSALRVATALLLALCGGSAAAGFARSQATVVAGGRPHRFQVELAVSAEERALGLMHRDQLAPDAGMLFLPGEDRVVTMWMKGTKLRLDILFLAADGTVRKVVENAEPFSAALLSSGVPVRAVLEVRGGTVRALGTRPGDRVLHPSLGQAR